METPPIAAVEIGTSRIRVAVGEIREDDHLQIIGLGECPSRGVRKGEIVDMDAALSCLKIALHQAEESADVAIKRVYVPVTGGHISSTVNRGSIPIIGNNLEIQPDHVENVLEIAKAVNLPPDREIIHSICQYYYLDDQKGVINPHGMEASKLAADVLIIHGHSGRMRNLFKLVKSIPLEIEDNPLAGLCSALAVLQPEDKENGALVIDLGGGTTDYLGYADSTIAVAGSLAIGGDHISNDIARGLRISMPNAERIKEQAGSAILNLANRTQKLELPSETGPDGRIVRIGDLHTITSLRAEEIFNMVKFHVGNGDLLQRFGAGVVLTGGGANMDKIGELAEKVFGMTCRIGKSRDISGLAATANKPDYATVIGLLRYASRTTRRAGSGKSLVSLWRRYITGEE
jgi:cell division protein FtsA